MVVALLLPADFDEFGSGTEDSVNVKSNYYYGHGAQSDNLKKMN